jgi:mRNA interferase RelE/StbE
VLNLSFSRDARRFLDGLPPKHAQQIALKIAALRANPQPHDAQFLKGKHAALRRVKSGEYRIVYDATPDTLTIVLVGKRNDDEVYKILNRKM